MRKIFTLFLSLVANVGIMLASDSQVDGIWYDFNSSTKTASVTYRGSDYDSYSDRYTGSVSIPSSVTYNAQEYSVTSIGYYAFWDCSGLTSVEIPNSVTSIRDAAFRGCSSLTSVTIPNSVTSIGSEAFYNCSGLTSVTIGNSVTSIGNNAFYGCTGLTSVTIGNSVTSIGDWAFGGCTGLTSITIPNSVTSIERSAFSGCSGLTSVTIGNSVTSIGEYAFAWCSGLISVAIPNSVTSIGSEAFYYCSNIKFVIWNAKNCASAPFSDIIDQITFFIFGDEVEVIPSSLCSGMSKLNFIEIPNSVTRIGDGAFDGCSGLTSVEIPNSVTSIGDKAFSNCTGLTSVTNYARTPQKINSNVFSNVNKSSCMLYVPEKSVNRYKSAEVWKDFGTIVGVEVPDPEPESVELDCTIRYEDKDENLVSSENLTFHVPVAPEFAGFTFVKWIANSDNIEDGITIQAVYTANTPTSAPEVYTNPANNAQKLIRNGNVYILTDDKTYTITGQAVK